MGIREEVAGGQFGGLLVDEMREQARRLVRGRPTTSGSAVWTASDIDELVNDTLEQLSGGLQAMVLAAHQAANDVQFTGWLQRALYNTLNRRARQTHRGQLIRAVDDALSEDQAFVLQNGAWALRSAGAATPVGGHELRVVAWSVDTSVHRLTATAARAPLLARRKAIRQVAEAVLAVSGPLRKADLTEILADRFNVTFEEHLGYLEAADTPYTAPSECAAEDHEAAQWLFDQLTEDERAVIQLLPTETVRGISATLGWKKHRVESVKGSALAKIRRMSIEFGSDAEAVLTALAGILGQEAATRPSAEVDGGDHGQ